MNTKSLALFLVAGLFAGAVRAQTTSATVSTPSTPAPAVPSATPEDSAKTPATTGVTQIVYTPRLPNVTDLTNAATAQGFTVERVVQTTNQVIAFYRNASGQPSTVAYQTLPPVGLANPAPAPVVVTSPPPVTYVQSPRVVYYDDYYPGYYAPRVWYPPISFNFGFGYRGGFYRGGYRHGR